MRPLHSVLATAALAGGLVCQTTIFGSACDRVSGVSPVFWLDPSFQPGRDVTARAVALPPAAPLALLLGFSSRDLGGAPLPLELTPLGLPGCSLLTSSDVALPFPATGVPPAIIPLPTSLLPAAGEIFLQTIFWVPSTGALSGVSYGLALRVPPPRADFTIAMLPDTQFYSEQSAIYFHFVGQTDWALRNADEIAFVTQVGDIVQNGARYPIEFARADAAMARLDPRVPYSVALGNHDFDVVNDKAAATAFTATFGAARWNGRPTFLGTSSNQRNSAHRFPTRSGDLLHLALEWRPNDAAIEWAQSVLSAHPSVPAIVSTHEHLGTGNPAPFRTGGATPDSGGNNAAIDVHRKLVEPFPQVFLVLCGHVHGPGRRIDRTIFGIEAHSILADYQSDVQGGNGWLRTLHFDPLRALLEVRPFSPTFIAGSGPDYTGQPDHAFDLAYDLIAHRQRLESERVARFREGQDFGAGPYLGGRDTRIGDGSNGGTLPGTPRGNDPLLFCDGDGDHDQSLLAFDGIVGNGVGQLPSGTRVRRAILTLTTEGDSAASTDGGRLHRMLVGWNEQSTWNLLGGGVQVGAEASASADLDTGGQVTQKGTVSFDVTASVQAWLDGAPNHGWVLIGNGNDGWGVRSTEHDAVVERPMLTVVW
ncbi:MAG: DNRLRE domain-containing protein [Planctomycetota bacterium]